MEHIPSQDTPVWSALLAWSDAQAREAIRPVLNQFACVTECAAAQVQQDVDRLLENKPDVVILQAPHWNDSVLANLLAIGKALPCPVVVTVPESAETDAATAVRHGASAFMVGEVDAARLKTVMQVAMERFRLTDALYSELNKSKSELAARKLIERAKGVVMERSGMSEESAYNEMRRMAMAQGKPLKDIAQSVLLVTGLFQIDQK